MKYYLFFTFYILSIMSASAQGENTNAQADTIERQRTTVSLASIYGSNVSYYGQVSENRMPYAVGNASVVFPFGLYFSAQTYKLFDSEPGFSGFNLTAGYSFDLTKRLSGQLSYGRSFYPENSKLLQSVNLDMASASLIYDWQWLITSVSSDYSPGQSDALYTSFNASKIIDLGISFSSKDYLTLEPEFELVGGTQRFSDTTYSQTSSDPNTDPPIFDPKNPGKGLSPFKLGEGFRKNGNNKGKVTDVLSDGDKATVVTVTTFDLVSYNFTLPLVYNRANYSIAASYQGSILSKSVSDSQKLQSFFNLGFYYMF